MSVSVSISGRGLAVIFTALLLVACDGKVNAPGQATLEPSVTETATMSGGNTPEAPAGTGVAISKSDVSGIPDSPISSGEVLYFSEERLSDLGDAGGFDPAEPGQYRHASFELSEAEVEGFDGLVTEIGDEGRFTVGVENGSYVMCLANSWPSHSPGPPYSVVGCDLAGIDERGGLTISHGEGGVQATQGAR